MNSMRMLASATHMPMRYFSGSIASSLVHPGGQSFAPEGPEPKGSPPPGPSFPPPAPSPGLVFTSAVKVVGILLFSIFYFLSSIFYLLFSIFYFLFFDFKVSAWKHPK